MSFTLLWALLHLILIVIDKARFKGVEHPSFTFSLISEWRISGDSTLVVPFLLGNYRSPLVTWSSCFSICWFLDRWSLRKVFWNLRMLSTLKVAVWGSEGICSSTSLSIVHSLGVQLWPLGWGSDCSKIMTHTLWFHLPVNNDAAFRRVYLHFY